MVIQTNMSSKAIAEVWINTKQVFEKHDFPLSEKVLKL